MLSCMEAEYTSIRLAELVTGESVSRFDFAALCDMHHYIFQDIYEWVGKGKMFSDLGDKRKPDLMQQKDESVRVYIGIVQSGMSMGNGMLDYILEGKAILEYRKHFVSALYNAVELSEIDNFRKQNEFSPKIKFWG